MLIARPSKFRRQSFIGCIANKHFNDFLGFKDHRGCARSRHCPKNRTTNHLNTEIANQRL